MNEIKLVSLLGPKANQQKNDIELEHHLYVF
jgi:hypothetical protein